MAYSILEDHDIEELAKQEQRKKIRLEAQLEAAEATIGKLQTELAQRAIRGKQISHGDLVTVRFREGQCDCIYEGLDLIHWYTPHRPRVRLRSFTKRGKPRKQARSCSPAIIQFMTRKDTTNG